MSKRKRVKVSFGDENLDPAVELPSSLNPDEVASKKKCAEILPTAALSSPSFIEVSTTKKKCIQEISYLQNLDPSVTLPLSNPEALPSKKRLVHQTSISEDSTPIDTPSLRPGSEPSVTKVKSAENISTTSLRFSPLQIPRSSIQSYFKPLQRRQSAPLDMSTAPLSRPTSSSSRSSAPSSNPTEYLDTKTPPSSPPTNNLTIISHAKNHAKKRPRRLTTRPLLPLPPKLSPQTTMASSSIAFLGDTDSTKIQPKEQEGKHRGCASGIVSSCAFMCNINHRLGQSIQTVSTTGSSQNPADIVHEETSKASPVFTPSASINIPTSKRATPYASFSQTVIDLGQASAMRVCTKCKMHYNSAIASERRAHTEFCDDMRLPLLTNAMIKRADFVVEIIKDGHIHRIRVVSSSCLRAEQQQAERILRHTYNELAGVSYSSLELWAHPGQFKIYIYYVDNTPVGVLLVGVKEGRQSMITFERLWIVQQHRRQGLASRLADAARSDFIGYAAVAKEGVEMVEPTEMGRAFARGYGIV